MQVYSLTFHLYPIPFNNESQWLRLEITKAVIAFPAFLLAHGREAEGTCPLMEITTAYKIYEKMER